MANFNIQRKGIRVTVVIFGPNASGKHAFLEKLRTLFLTPGEMTSVSGDGGELCSFSSPLEPRKIDGVELSVRFLTARDHRGDGTVWNAVLKQADGVVFVADSGQGQEFENLRAQSFFNQLFQCATPDSALVFFYNKSDFPGAIAKDRLDGELNHWKKPSFTGSAISGAGVEDAALGVVKATFSRFQRQFEEMGGKGRIEARLSFSPAEPPASVSRQGEHSLRVTTSPPPAEGHAESPSDEMPMGFASGLIETDPSVDEAVREVVSGVHAAVSPDDMPNAPLAATVSAVSAPPQSVEPEEVGKDGEAPATGAAADVPPAGGDEEIEKKLRTVSASIAAFRPLYESVTLSAVSARMLMGKIEGIERSMNPLMDVDFGEERALAVAARLKMAAAADTSAMESEDLAQKLLAVSASITALRPLCTLAMNTAISARALLGKLEGIERSANALTEVDFSEEDVQKVVARLTDAAVKIAALDEKISGLNRRLENGATELAQEQAHATEEIARLKAEVAAGDVAMKVEMDGLRAALTAAGSREEDLRARIGTAQGEIESAKAEGVQAMTVVAAIREECDTLTGRAVTAAGEAVEFKRAAEKLATDNADLCQKLADAEVLQAAIEEENQALAGLVDGHSARVSELEGVIKAHVSEIEALRQEARRTDAAKAEETKAASGLGQQLVDLQLEMHMRDDEIALLKAVVEARKSDVKTLGKQVADLTNQLHAMQPRTAGAPPAAPKPVTPPSVVKAVLPTSGVTSGVRPPATVTPPPAPPVAIPPSGGGEAPAEAGTKSKPVSAVTSAVTGAVTPESAHAGARQMAKVLVAMFIRKHEKELIQALKRDTFKTDFDLIVREARGPYDSRVPAIIGATNDYFKEELDAAIEELKKKG